MAWQDLEACQRNSKRSYDLVIIATLATGRLHVVEKACSKFDFKNILIEKPIEQSRDAIIRLNVRYAGVLPMLITLVVCRLGTKK